MADILTGLTILCCLVILSALLKSQKWAAAVFFLLLGVWAAFGGGLSVALVAGALFSFALMRFGLITLIILLFTGDMINGADSAITLNSSAWYAPYGYLVLAILAAMVFYAFRFSRGGRPLLASSRLDE